MNAKDNGKNLDEINGSIDSRLIRFMNIHPCRWIRRLIMINRIHIYDLRLTQSDLKFTHDEMPVTIYTL